MYHNTARCLGSFWSLKTWESKNPQGPLDVVKWKLRVVKPLFNLAAIEKHNTQMQFCTQACENTMQSAKALEMHAATVKHNACSNNVTRSESYSKETIICA